MKPLAFILTGLLLIGSTRAAEESILRPGDGTIPLRVSALEDDVKIVKSDIKKLLAYFDSHAEAPRRPTMARVAPKKKVSHHKPKPKCCPPPAPMTTCAPKCYIPVRVVCPPMTTCGPRYYPMTTCSPKRVSCWGR